MSVLHKGMNKHIPGKKRCTHGITKHIRPLLFSKELDLNVKLEISGMEMFYAILSNDC